MTGPERGPELRAVEQLAVVVGKHPPQSMERRRRYVEAKLWNVSLQKGSYVIFTAYLMALMDFTMSGRYQSIPSKDL